jgi:thymidylate synthase
MNIEHDYLRLLKDILSNGVAKDDRTGTGTLSVFGRQIRHSMSEGFPLLTTKKLPFKTIVTELLWFLQGRTDLRYLLENGCNIWNGDAYKNYKLKHNFQINQGIEILSQEEFIEKIKTDDEFNKWYGDLGPIYGKQWRSCKKYKWDEIDFEFRIEYVDQIENLINDIKADPDSRRLMVSAWNVAEIDHMTLPPCHYGFQVYTRELTWEEQVQWVMKNTDVEWENLYIVEEISKDTTPKRTISLMWNQRSVDTFLGLPFNIASYGLLLEIIAKATNMIPDELIGNLGDTHLYLNHIEQAKEQLTREPMPLSKLNINTEFWPSEGGECGEGLLDAVAVFKGFNDDNFCKCLLESDIQLGDYQSHPAIKAPLSN